MQDTGARKFGDDSADGKVDAASFYDAFAAQNMVRSLQRDGQSWFLLYDADGTRVVREDAASNSATYNVGSTYELRFDGAELSEARISVLGATGRVVAEVFAERTALEGNGLWENRKKFVHDDHLGSAHMISDREGAVEARVMYGPWGAARDGSNWYLPLPEGDLDALPTGFTGHQPELDTGLINMRGRMYDPMVGRFMSVDPVIENALEVGTWNAYSYVLNRPLSLVDPTGLAAWQGTQADIDRHSSFLAEQGFVGADYHDAEAYFAQIEFWKPYKAQTHGPRAEAEVKKSANGKSVQETLCDILSIAGRCSGPVQGASNLAAAAESEPASTCREWERNCQIGVLSTEVAKNTKATKATIEDWIVMMEWALMIADGAAILALARALGKAGLKILAKQLMKQCVAKGKCLDEALPAVARQRACFVEGTLVSTGQGLVPVEDIQAGDFVLSYDGDTGEWVYAEVSRPMKKTHRGHLVHMLLDGQELVSTDEHPFCVVHGEDLSARLEATGLEDERGRCARGGRWLEASTIERGDFLAASDGIVEVLAIDASAFKNETPVYNLAIDSTHTYSVLSSEVLVHNKPWMSSQGWAADYANQLVKHFKQAGVGTGARSGQHGAAYNRAATALRQTIKQKGAKTAKGELIELDAEVIEELIKYEKKFLNKAREINHAVK